MTLFPLAASDAGFNGQTCKAVQVFGQDARTPASAAWSKVSTNLTYPLRPSILELVDAFEASGPWNREEVFEKWAQKQEFRKALPPVRRLLGKTLMLAVLQSNLQRLVPQAGCAECNLSAVGV